MAHGGAIPPHRDPLAGLVEALSHSHEQIMALESLPAHSAGDQERAWSEAKGEPAQQSVEELFQRFGETWPATTCGPTNRQPRLPTTAGPTTTIVATTAATTTDSDSDRKCSGYFPW